MTVTPVIFANKLKQHLGYNYRVGPSRCTGTGGYHDCSGYMCWGMNETGLTHGLCTSSFAIAIWCWDLGLRIGEDEARHTDGVFAVRGADYGRRSGGAANGSDGHIVAAYVPSTGGTYEAMGRRYGVVQGAFDGRGWTGFYKIPGMDYAPPVPPAPKEEPELMLIYAPKRQQGANHFRPAAVALDPANKRIVRLNQAQVNEPDGIPLAAGARIWGWYETFKDNTKPPTDDNKKGFMVVATASDATGNPGFEFTWKS